MVDTQAIGRGITLSRSKKYISPGSNSETESETVGCWGSVMVVVRLIQKSWLSDFSHSAAKGYITADQRAINC